MNSAINTLNGTTANPASPSVANAAATPAEPGLLDTLTGEMAEASVPAADPAISFEQFITLDVAQPLLAVEGELPAEGEPGVDASQPQAIDTMLAAMAVPMAPAPLAGVMMAMPAMPAEAGADTAASAATVQPLAQQAPAAQLASAKAGADAALVNTGAVHAATLAKQGSTDTTPGAATPVPATARQGEEAHLAVSGQAGRDAASSGQGQGQAQGQAQGQGGADARALAQPQAASPAPSARTEAAASREADLPHVSNVGAGTSAGQATAARAADTVTLTGTPASWRQNLQEALGNRMQMQLGRGVEQATIRLEPPMLGRIDISIRHSAGSLEVNIAATHGEVLRQLQAVSDTLRGDLASRQYSDVSVNVSQATRTQASGQAGLAHHGADAQGRGQKNEQDQDERKPGQGLHEASQPGTLFTLN